MAMAARTVAVLGASGGVGSAVVKKALANGFKVRALARSKSKAMAALGDEAFGQLDAFIEGDVSDASALAALLKDGGDEHPVVMSCLGTPKGMAPCVESGTRFLMDAMALRGWKRLVMISSIGVGDSLEQGRGMAPIFIRCIVPCFLSKVFGDLERAEELCWTERGGVKCVAVRPPALTDKPGRGNFTLASASDPRPSKTAKIPREDVAAAMVQLADPTAFGQWAGKGVTVVVP